MRSPTVLALAILGCSTGAPQQAGRPIDTFPRFTAEQSAWFDDAIATDIFGMETHGRQPETDAALVERVKNADSVLPVRVSTVTSDMNGTTVGFQLVLTPTGPAMAGTLQRQPITVTVPSTSESYPFVKASDATLVGRRLLLFFRRFSETGQVVVHWHAELDTFNARLAVLRAAANKPRAP